MTQDLATACKGIWRQGFRGQFPEAKERTGVLPQALGERYLARLQRLEDFVRTVYSVEKPRAEDFLNADPAATRQAYEMIIGKRSAPSSTVDKAVGLLQSDADPLYCLLVLHERVRSWWGGQRYEKLHDDLASAVDSLKRDIYWASYKDTSGTRHLRRITRDSYREGGELKETSAGRVKRLLGEVRSLPSPRFMRYASHVTEAIDAHVNLLVEREVRELVPHGT